MRFPYVVSFAVAAAVAAWVLSGDLGQRLFDSGPSTTKLAAPSQPAPAANLGKIERPFAVRVQTQTASIRSQEISVNGHTEASRSVVIRAETSGVINHIRVDKGDRVTAGQIIATLDLGDRPARLAEVESLVAQRQLELNIASSLAAQGQQAMTRVVAAQTALASAAAALARIEIEIKKTEISAPFDGIIEDRQIQIGDFISPGSPTAILVDEDPFLVVGQVSENDIDKIILGGPGTTTLLEGLTLSGTIKFIATVSDPQTRTFRVELEVKNPDRNLRAGATADFLIPVDTVAAHLVSPAVLVLDDEGNPAVKLVNLGVVEQVPVTVVASDENGIWLTGLPETATIITVGQHFVSSGQTVTTVEDDGAVNR
jgi:multidrug efflux system membrane fusion protein